MPIARDYCSPVFRRNIFSLYTLIGPCNSFSEESERWVEMTEERGNTKQYSTKYLDEAYDTLMTKSVQAFEDLNANPDEVSELDITEVVMLNRLNEELKGKTEAPRPGIARLTDGRLYITSTSDYPNATGDMILWWFAYCQNTDQYRLWHPYDHKSSTWTYCQQELEERRRGYHIGNTHIVEEYIGGKLGNYYIEFLDPSLKPWNLTKETLESANITASLCAKIHTRILGLGRVQVGHFLHAFREDPTKKEPGKLTSYFWLGDITPYGWIANCVCSRRFLGPRKLGEHVMKHCSEEYTCLASILPEIYENEIPNWKNWRKKSEQS